MFEDRGGILTLVGGLVAISVVATGLALVMEKRSDSAKANEETERSLVADQEEIEITRVNLNDALLKWTEVSRLQQVEKKYQEVKAVAGRRDTRLAELRVAHTSLKAAVGEQDGSYKKYQADYRSMVRAAAIGEEISVLRLKNGKEYSKVAITRVTADGLEIRHEFGTARVVAADLEETWNERFHWRRTEALSLVD